MSRLVVMFVIWALALPSVAVGDQKSRRHRVKKKPHLQFSVLRFSREQDLWLPQIFSGLTAAQVKARTGADFVFTSGFLNIKKVRGEFTFTPVNLHIIDGNVKVPAFFPQEKVMADFPWGGPTIFNSITQCLSYGTPTTACGLKRIPPVPAEKTGRRIWAIKGSNFFVVDYFGSRVDGQRIARNYGFESSAHSDGGHMVSPYARGASFALIFKGKKQLAMAGLFNPLANLAL